MAFAHSSPVNAKITLEDFQLVIQAIKDKNTALVKDYITKKPEIFNCRTSNFDTLLHIAARHGNKDIIKAILDHLKKIGRAKTFASFPDKNSDSPLHLAAEFNCFEVVELIADALGDKLDLVTKHVNNRGLTPLLAAEKNPSFTQQWKLKNFLLHLTVDYSCKRLDEEIKEADILAEYKVKKGSSLEANLKLGCKAINLTRKMLKGSQTIPDVKFHHEAKAVKFQLSTQQKALRDERDDDLDKRIKDLRNELKPIWDTIEKSKFSLSKNNPALQKAKSILKKHAFANCEEMALLTLIHTLEISQTTDLIVDDVTIADKHSGHAFNFIGRRNDTDLNDPKTWPDDMVVADAYSGIVIPAKTMFDHRLVYFQYIHMGVSYDILAYPNQAYHKLTPWIANAAYKPAPKPTPTVSGIKQVMYPANAGASQPAKTPAAPANTLALAS